MKKIILVIAIAFLAATGGVLYFFIKESKSPSSACANESGTIKVVMKKGKFEPKEFSVKKCTKVLFQNSDTTGHWPASDYHPTHGIYPEFDPQQGIDPGKSWSFIFDKIGTWKFHDHLFPLIRGKITVTE